MAHSLTESISQWVTGSSIELSDSRLDSWKLSFFWPSAFKIWTLSLFLSCRPASSCSDNSSLKTSVFPSVFHWQAKYWAHKCPITVQSYRLASSLVGEWVSRFGQKSNFYRQLSEYFSVSQKVKKFQFSWEFMQSKNQFQSQISDISHHRHCLHVHHHHCHNFLHWRLSRCKEVTMSSKKVEELNGAF